VEAVLPKLDEMVGEGMLTIERVHVIAYRGQKKDES
jgi:PII-like signaling protein